MITIDYVAKNQIFAMTQLGQKTVIDVMLTMVSGNNTIRKGRESEIQVGRLVVAALRP